jgi:2'-aminobiphenyl-2,3-diol 1,2-dioxygenase large subunit
MAEVVCAYATSHILFDPAADPPRVERILAGMQELGRRATSAQPDVLLIITSEHMFNMDLCVQPPFCVGTADSWTPFGDLDIPQRPFPGQREFARGLLTHCASSGFDLAVAETLRPDHGVTLPLLFIRPWGQIPAVPLFVNINMDPVPSPARCLALAESIREYIATERPTAERVGVIASGGLSHWLMIPGTGNIAEEFDEEWIERFTAGRGREFARLSCRDIVANAGNGGLELINWMMMTAMVPAAKGEKIYYEPMPAWMTAIGGIAMTV